MPLQFLSTRLTFHPVMRTVYLMALADDDLVDVVIARPVIERLAAIADLSRDEAITTVVRHKRELEAAAAHAFENAPSGVRIITVRMPDLTAAIVPSIENAS